MRIRIFLASSKELESDRRDFELFLSRRNQLLHDRGIFCDLVIWETFFEAMSKTRLQDEYNKAIGHCDAFVMIFWSRVGKYTQEEFEIAFGEFKKNNRPLVFTYFKSSTKTQPSCSSADLQSVQEFQSRLNSLGHFCSTYKNSEDLQLQFGRQLDILQLSEEWSERSGSAALSVSVLKHPTWRAAKVGRPELSYREKSQDGKLTIEPDMPYLRDLGNAEQVKGIRYWDCPFDWEFPEFDVRILNNSDSTIAVEELIVEVRDSMLDETPILVVRDGTYNCLELANEGWGEVFASTLKLEFPESGFPSMEIPVGDFSHSRRIPLELPSVGNNIEDFSERAKRIATIGSLHYHTEGNGRRRHCFRFMTHVFIGAQPDAAPSAPTARYHIWINAGESPQTVSIPCSHSIPIDELDRFIVAIAADKSHRFEFRFRFRTVGSPDLVSDYMVCKMLVPRSGREQFGRGLPNAVPTTSFTHAENVTINSHQRSQPSAGFWVGVDSALVAESPNLQIMVLNDLNSPSEDQRRTALDVVRRCLAPNELTRRYVLELVKNEQSLGVFGDALNLLVSGGFTPEIVVQTLAARFQSERQGQGGMHLLLCANVFWLYVGNSSPSDMRICQALSNLPEQDLFDLTALESFLLECGMIDEELADDTKRMLKRARAPVQ